ncbi:sulfatase [Thalassoglobus sp.]|uniref:sulfatase n=1 Tax=Thalassoglobus sp. TaxID=2795869 RepID=UPI003AA93CB4
MPLRVIFLCVVALMSSSVVADDRPNFVFILVDDLGYMDIGANNPDTFYETPNVDRLAQEGIRFSDGYAANPVCSPTRYSILTGKYPTRVDATNFFAGKRESTFRPAPLNDRMPLEETTIAEQMRHAGYKTAFLGKWHLGPTEAYWPDRQGFDLNVGGHVRGLPKSYFSPYKNPRLEDGPKGEYLTERLTNETLNILEQYQDDPFFLYLAFYTVHTPLQAPQDLVQKYRKKAEQFSGLAEFAEEEQVWPNAPKRQVRILQKHATYAAMVEVMDTSVGRILEKLKQLGIDDETVVCFFSDNGGLSTSEGSPTSNLPFRGGKGWLYEGGIREPMIIKWPQGGQSNVVRGEAVSSVDFYPTFLEIAGIEASQDLQLDGVSLVPLLTGGHLEDRSLFWHYPHYSNQGGFPGGAIRTGNYKLVERYEDGRTHLYNLADDPGEEHDLSSENPTQVARMRKELHQWYKDVDAKFLQPNSPDQTPWRP